MTPLKASAMKGLGDRRLRRRVEAANQKDLESLELKEILTLYKDLFNTDPPRKNKFLMVKKIKERQNEMEEGSAAAGGPKTKAKAASAAKAKVKAAPAATAKAKAKAAPKARAKAKAAPKVRAPSARKAKTPAAPKAKAKAKAKPAQKAKPKPKPKPKRKTKAKPAAVSKEASKGGSSGEPPQRALRTGKRKNYSEDLKVSVDAVGRIVRKVYNGQTFMGYVTEVSVEAGLATVRWQDGSDERVFPDSLQETIVEFDDMLGYNLVLDSSFAAEVLDLIEVAQDSMQVKITGYVPENRGYTVEAEVDGAKVAGSLDFVYVGPYLMMQSLPRPAAPPGETSSLEWDDEDELSVCIFCYGISSTNGPAVLRCPKWASVMQLKALINQRVGGTLPERRQRLSTFSEGKMREIGPEVDGPGALISKYGITNMEEDNHIVLELLPDRLDAHQKKLWEYHQILAGFKLSVEEMVEQRAANRRVRQKTVRAGISGAKREYMRWTEAEVDAVLDGAQDFLRKNKGKSLPVSKMYDHIAKSKKLSGRSVEDVKTKVRGLQTAAGRPGGREAMRAPVSEKTFKRMRKVFQLD